MPYQFRNLVFEGGGVKGIAYVGAMEVLGRRRVLRDIVRVGGTSAGAINACLFALGYSNPDTKRVLAKLDFQNFLDEDWGVLRDSKRLMKSYGWYKGDFFRNWVAERIRKKLGDGEATFRDLRAAGRPDLYVYGTNLTTSFGEVFSVEHTPGMSIADAVRISMSIPLFFAAVRRKRRATADDIYVDGGLLDNYPVKLFDRLHYIDKQEQTIAARQTDYYQRENRRLKRRLERAKVPQRRVAPYVYNRQTLGLRLDSPQEITVFRDGRLPARRDIDDFFGYAKALVGTVLEAQATQHLHSDDWQRTVYINTLDVATTDFDISDHKQMRLIESGRSGTNAYFDWFNARDAEPVNRCPD